MTIDEAVTDIMPVGVVMEVVVTQVDSASHSVIDRDTCLSENTKKAS